MQSRKYPWANLARYVVMQSSIQDSTLPRRRRRVDNCPHTFGKLASKVLPGHMKKLRRALRSPHPSAMFAIPNVGPSRVARDLGLKEDFSGCYVLIDRRPLYVGISRKVLSRLRQQLLGRSHFEATLAYAMARKHHRVFGKRSGAMQDPAFRKEFEACKGHLRGLSVAFITIDNPVELHVFEAYAAMALHTGQWNTFRTH